MDMLGTPCSSYADPDAPTAVASKTLTYDNNGNLTALGTSTFSWNYRNRMTQSGSGLATSTYGYDDQDARVWLKEGNTKTIFPNQLYNVVLGTTTATTTKHIMVGDLPVATIENVGTTTTSTTTAVINKRFAVTDHLGSVAAMLTASGTVAEMTDAYPYGGICLDTKSGSYVGEKNKYSQTQYDSTANLNYAQARYQDRVRGQFLSQDPVFLGDPSQQTLTDPQSLNGYGYANDNPINKSDPTGRCIEDGCVGEFAVMAARAYVVNVAMNETALVAGNVYGNVQQGLQTNSLSPASFVPTVSRQQYLTAAAEAVPASLLGPIGSKVARLAGVSSLLGSSVGVAVGAGVTGELEQPYTGDSQGKIAATAALNGLGNCGAGKYFGGTPGRDVKSVFSPNFYFGSHMQNEFRSGAAAQAIVSGGSVAYVGLVASLSRLVTRA